MPQKESMVEVLRLDSQGRAIACEEKLPDDVSEKIPISDEAWNRLVCLFRDKPHLLPKREECFFYQGGSKNPFRFEKNDRV